MPQDHTTAELTPCEIMVLRRRRLGLAQVEMAIRLGVSIRIYQAWEESREGQPPPSNALFRGVLHQHEWCYIRRRRSGLSRKQVAVRIGRSEQWVTKMERGKEDCTILFLFWENREATRAA